MSLLYMHNECSSIYLHQCVLLKQLNIVPNDQIKNIIQFTVGDSCLEWGYAFSTCSLKQCFHTVPFFCTGPSSIFFFFLIKAWTVVTEQTCASGKDKLLKLLGRGGQKESDWLRDTWNTSNWLCQLERACGVWAGGITICPFCHSGLSC